MEEDCEEIYASGLLDRYTKRPPKLELRMRLKMHKMCTLI